MKKINSKGFTLIELLAVIVIMGILMMVAIPSVSRVIENSRKDTYVDIAKSYANAARTLWTADGLSCTSESIPSSATDDGDYYVLIDTEHPDNVPVLVDQGGKSSWGNRNVEGYVRINVTTTTATATAEPKRVTKFYVALSDGTHYVDDTKVSDNLVRGDVVMKIDAAKKTLVAEIVDSKTKGGTAINTCVEA